MTVRVLPGLLGSGGSEVSVQTSAGIHDMNRVKPTTWFHARVAPGSWNDLHVLMSAHPSPAEERYVAMLFCTSAI